MLARTLRRSFCGGGVHQSLKTCLAVMAVLHASCSYFRLRGGRGVLSTGRRRKALWALSAALQKARWAGAKSAYPWDFICFLSNTGSSAPSSTTMGSSLRGKHLVLHNRLDTHTHTHTHTQFSRCTACASWFLPFHTRGESDQNPGTGDSARAVDTALVS